MGWPIPSSQVIGTEIKIHVTYTLQLDWIELTYHRDGMSRSGGN